MNWTGQATGAGGAQAASGREQTRCAARGRPLGRRRHPARAALRLPMAGGRPEPWQAVCAPGSRWENPGRARHRQHPCQGLSPCSRAKEDMCGPSAAHVTDEPADPRSGQRPEQAGRLHLTPGFVADISTAKALLDDTASPQRPWRTRPAVPDHLGQRLRALNTEVVIPFDGCRQHPCPLARVACQRATRCACSDA